MVIICLMFIKKNSRSNPSEPANMSGAYSKPMPWAGGGSTKPPMANNYLDSHGLNPGLGNAGHASFPSVVTAAPSQAARMANYTRCEIQTKDETEQRLFGRFSPSDWSASNIDHYNSADSSRNQSERIRNEAVRLIREREDKTTLTQRDSDRRIGERLHDEVYQILILTFCINLSQTFWRSELQSELERNVNETHHLETTRKNLERAIAETEGPMRVNAECIYNR